MPPWPILDLVGAPVASGASHPEGLTPGTSGASWTNSMWDFTLDNGLLEAMPSEVFRSR